MADWKKNICYILHRQKPNIQRIQRAPTNQKEQFNRPMGKRYETHEKAFNSTSCQGNANEDNNEIPFFAIQLAKPKMTDIIMYKQGGKGMGTVTH